MRYSAVEARRRWFAFNRVLPFDEQDEPGTVELSANRGCSPSAMGQMTINDRHTAMQIIDSDDPRSNDKSSKWLRFAFFNAESHIESNSVIQTMKSNERHPQRWADFSNPLSLLKACWGSVVFEQPEALCNLAAEGSPEALQSLDWNLSNQSLGVSGTLSDCHPFRLPSNCRAKD